MKRRLSYFTIIFLLIILTSCHSLLGEKTLNTTTTAPISHVNLVGFEIKNQEVIDGFYFQEIISDKIDTSSIAFNLYQESMTTTDSISTYNIDANYYFNKNTTSCVMLKERYYDDEQKELIINDGVEICDITNLQVYTYRVENVTLNIHFQALYKYTNYTVAMLDENNNKLKEYEYDLSLYTTPVIIQLTTETYEVIVIQKYLDDDNIEHTIRNLYTGMEMRHYDRMYSLDDLSQLKIFDFWLFLANNNS